jgi:hypothetical protein
LPTRRPVEELPSSTAFRLESPASGRRLTAHSASITVRRHKETRGANRDTTSPPMKGLLLRLATHEADAETCVRVIAYYDALVERRASPEAQVRATSRGGEVLQRVTAGRRPNVTVEPRDDALYQRCLQRHGSHRVRRQRQTCLLVAHITTLCPVRVPRGGAARRRGTPAAQRRKFRT